MCAPSSTAMRTGLKVFEVRISFPHNVVHCHTRVLQHPDFLFSRCTALPFDPVTSVESTDGSSLDSSGRDTPAELPPVPGMPYKQQKNTHPPANRAHASVRCAERSLS